MSHHHLIHCYCDNDFSSLKHLLYVTEPGEVEFCLSKVKESLHFKLPPPNLLHDSKVFFLLPLIQCFCPLTCPDDRLLDRTSKRDPSLHTFPLLKNNSNVCVGVVLKHPICLDCRITDQLITQSFSGLAFIHLSQENPLKRRDV